MRREGGGRSAKAVSGVLAACLALAAACAAAAPSTGPAGPGMPPGAQSRMGEDYLYICIQGEAKVAVLDIATRQLVETIDLTQLGFTANAKPHHVAVEPDGSFWYLSLIGENRILKFDAANNLVGQAEFEVPGMLAIHPTEDLLVAGRSMSAVNPPQRIGLVRRSDMSTDEYDVFFPRPHAIAIAPDGAHVYTASLGTNQLASVELTSERLELTPLEGPQHTIVQFAISPDGSTMVGTAQLTGRLLTFDLSDPARPRLTAEVEVNDQPWHPVFTPDGRFAYFGNKTANSISVVDVMAGKVVAVLEGEGIAAPHGSAVSPDGRWVFISSNGAPMASDPSMPGEGSVVVIDTSTRQVVEVIPTGVNTTGLGARPGPAR